MTIEGTPIEGRKDSARAAWMRALQKTASIEESQVTLPILITGLARTFGAAPALLSDRGSSSYAQLADRSNPLCALGARPRAWTRATLSAC